MLEIGRKGVLSVTIVAMKTLMGKRGDKRIECSHRLL